MYVHKCRLKVDEWPIAIVCNNIVQYAHIQLLNHLAVVSLPKDRQEFVRHIKQEMMRDVCGDV